MRSKLLPAIGVTVLTGASFMYFTPAKISSPTSAPLALDTIAQAVIQIESGGNPKAERYEPHIKDTSYGLMQLLTATAKSLEKRHAYLPRLGTSTEAIKASLTNGEINVQYGTTLLEEELAYYGDAQLAIAAYNAGHFAPRNARVQEQLNDILGAALKPDGGLGKQSQEAIRRFQQQYNQEHPSDCLQVDGLLGEQTYKRLQEAWTKKNKEKSNPKGRIPENKYTLNHIRKFRTALENILHKRK